MPNVTRTPGEGEKEKDSPTGTVTQAPGPGESPSTKDPGESAIDFVTNAATDGAASQGQPPLRDTDRPPTEGVSDTTAIQEEASKAVATGNNSKFRILGSLVGSFYQGKEITFKEFCEAQGFGKETGRSEMLRLIDAGVVERVK